MLTTTILAILLLGLAAGALPAHAEKVTFGALLGELTDLDALTRMPNPAYTCKQFSSYDRASTNPSILTDENWFANNDRGQYLHAEEGASGKEYVLMDSEGPGAIVRVWSADPHDAGILRIYVDGDKQPVIEMPMEAMLKGETFPFLSPIACVRAAGWTSYVPLPYAHHCKVTASQPDFYYHIDYRTYAPNTSVQTITQETFNEHIEQIRALATALTEPDKAFQHPKNAQETNYGVTAEPGETVRIAAIDGASKLYSLTMRVEAADLQTALRGVLLEISADNERAPVVCAPIGDFFGTAPGNRPYLGLPCGLTPDGVFYSHWVMPFRYGAVVRVTNYTKESVNLTGTTIAAWQKWRNSNLLFHAKWHGVTDLPTRPRQDFNFLRAGGAGRFVGVMLNIANPVAAWWGEGDEKIYVDGETFPSTFGTGSEDYFSYAWSSPEVYTHPFHSQPRCDGPGNFGYSCENRFQILDNIPFTTSFKFDFEVWHWEDCIISQSVVPYWYSQSVGDDNIEKPKPEQLVVPSLPEPKRVEGAIEGEKMRIIACTGGKAAPQPNAFNWSNAAQIWWQDGKVGDSLSLGFPVEKTGRYEVYASFTKAPDYGIAHITLNGKSTGKQMDFYHDKIVITPETKLGVFELKAGENEIAFKITGANSDALPHHMVGLDYILLKPAHKK
jgi:hypothetical protein